MQARFRSLWKTINQHRVISIVLLLILIMAIIVTILFGWNWTGFNGGYPKVTTKGKNTESEQPLAKTLWDWLDLLIIPVVLAIGGYLLNRALKKSELEATEKRAKTDREIALDSQQESALQAYINAMSDLLLKEHLCESVSEKKVTNGSKSLLKCFLGSRLKSENEVRQIARARTLTVLSRLDGKRKGSVLQFLHDAHLIDKDKTIIDVTDANFRSAVVFDSFRQKDGSEVHMYALLENVNLNVTFLRGAILREAHLQNSSIMEADLTGADLRGADLRGTDLTGSLLVSAYLGDAILSSATLIGADLSYADLSGAIGITTEKLEKQAKSLQGTTMPNGIKHADQV